MKYLKTYLSKIIARGNVQLAESIQKTSEEVGDKYISTFSFTSHEIGLLFGNIQSGKTGQMFGIICKATDLGFPAFVILTTDNVLLQQQTLERAKADLEGFCICGENDSGLFIENNLEQPVIVVLKKNSRMLKLWANVFNTTGFMKGNPLFVLDDEADAASLNTLVNKNKQSSINKYLDSIKNGASSSLYLQVTGTPQAIILQTVASGWHPYFTHYFQPGKAYLGGDFFFPNTGKPDCVTFTDTEENVTRAVLIKHLTVSAQVFASGGNVSNCIIHPSVRQAVHQSYKDEMIREINWCIEHKDDELITLIKSQYSLLSPVKSNKADINVIMEKVISMLTNNEIKVLIMNGKSDISSEEYLTGCNIVIGGNTLGRGVTFPALHTIYYTRTAKKPQADTMWQHSRMFGYDRDAGLMMVYIEKNLYKLFADINATNNSIVSQIERGIENIKVYYPKEINPTRKNVLDEDHVEAISGGTNYYSANPDNNTTEEISKLLENFSEDEKYYQVNLRLLKEILLHIVPSPDFKLLSFTSTIDTLLAEYPTKQGILIVRRNRDVSQGTGALLSPNDWQLGGRFQDKVVLTMYQVKGIKGWKEQNLWVPNIKLPNDIVYYDISG